MPNEEEKDLTAEREKRCIPIARELFKRLANREDLPFGEVDGGRDYVIEYFQKVYIEDFLPYLIEQNITMGEIKFVFKLMLQPIYDAQYTTEATLIDLFLNKATCALWGKTGPAESVDNVTIKELDEVLSRYPELKLQVKVDESVDK